MLTLACAQGAQAVCSVSSSPTTPHLLELYTSEGCSSCPPAEQWYRGLQANDQIVPLEFHVDYWDDLGWTDHYAHHEYTLRQQSLASRGGSGIVYTPEVAIDGREWREWSRSNFPSAGRAPFALRLDVEWTEAVTSRLVLLEPENDTSGYHAYFALLEDHISSRIGAGENRGRTLQHDHVVRNLIGPVGLSQAEAHLALPAGLTLANASIVAFVTRGPEEVPIR